MNFSSFLFQKSNRIYAYSVSGLAINFQTRAAIAAPTSGAKINSQTCDNASPPANNAGPKLLAGLTLVPVKYELMSTLSQ